MIEGLKFLKFPSIFVIVQSILRTKRGPLKDKRQKESLIGFFPFVSLSVAVSGFKKPGNLNGPKKRQEKRFSPDFFVSVGFPGLAKLFLYSDLFRNFIGGLSITFLDEKRRTGHHRRHCSAAQWSRPREKDEGHP